METLALDPLILSGPVLPPRDDTPPSRPVPCSGALCSGYPAVPPLTGPPIMPDGDGDWAIPISPPARDNPGSIARPDEEPCLVLADHPSSIFHPPRRHP